MFLQKNGSSETPRSYRQGVLLRHVQNNLRNVQSDFSDCGNELLVSTSSGECFTVTETTQKNFLQYTVVATFVLPLTLRDGGEAVHVSVSHTGWVKRTGLHAKAVTADARSPLIAQRILESPEFLENALRLDFTRFEIVGEKENARAEVCLYGASEVVSRFPSFRRYIGLDQEQQEALTGSFTVLRALLSNG